MKKKISILFFLVVFLVFFCCHAFAILDSVVPSPVYSVPMGAELEKLKNTAEQLLYLYEQLRKLEEQVKKLDNQEALFKALLSNEDILNLVDTDFSDMDVRDWKEFIVFSYELFFPNKNIATVTQTEEVNEGVIEKAEKTVDILSGAVTTVTDSTLYHGNVPEEERRKQETQNKLENLEKRYSMVKNNLVDLQLKYNEYAIDDKGEVVKLINDHSSNDNNLSGNSVRRYIDEKQKELKTIEDNINEYGNNANITTLLNVTNKLLIQNNDISLQILLALSDLNAQEFLNNTFDNHEKAREKYIQIKHEELR